MSCQRYLSPVRTDDVAPYRSEVASCMAERETGLEPATTILERLEPSLRLRSRMHSRMAHRRGVGIVAAISGLCAAAALAWALRTRAWRWIIASAFVWWVGWLLGVAIAVGLGLSGGTAPAAWTAEHAVIAGVLGLAWGSVTSPDARRVLEESQLLARLASWSPGRGLR
jgi:hypothetical protein